jgi:hypothetical protein
MYTFYHDSRTQVIYLAGEVNMPGTISALALNVQTIPGQTMENWTIRMKHTTLSSYSPASFQPDGWTVVYQTNETISSTGWKVFNFSVPFEYNGTDNLLIDFSHNNSNYTSSGNCTYSTPGGTRSAYAYSDSGYGDPLNWSGTTSPTVTGVTMVPNIRLTVCVAVPSPDLDNDDDVDFGDYAILAYQWLQSPGSPSADIDPPGGDGIVDFNDLAVLVDSWVLDYFVEDLMAYWKLDERGPMPMTQRVQITGPFTAAHCGRAAKLTGPCSSTGLMITFRLPTVIPSVLVIMIIRLLFGFIPRR